MNIVFWSMSSGRSATSGNMLAVSTMASLVYSIKGLLIQLDCCSRPIDDVFEGKRQTNLLMEEYAYYSKKGMDQLVDLSQLGDLNIADLLDNAVPVKNTNISYIPVLKRANKGVESRDIITCLKRVLELLEGLDEINYIDCTNGQHPVSKAILKEADVIVVNISQGMNLQEIDLPKDVLKKAVFLVGKYDDDSNESVNDIRKRYKIDRDSIGVIPYNIRFHDSLQQGKLIPYMSKYISSRRSDENFYFINSVFKATTMILRKAGYDDGREDIH